MWNSPIASFTILLTTSVIGSFDRATSETRLALILPAGLRLRNVCRRCTSGSAETFASVRQSLPRVEPPYLLLHGAWSFRGPYFSGDGSRPCCAKIHTCLGSNLTLAETARSKSRFGEKPRCLRGTSECNPLCLFTWRDMWSKLAALPRLAQSSVKLSGVRGCTPACHTASVRDSGCKPKRQEFC